VAIVILLATYGLYAGRERIVALILGLYPAALVYQTFPYWHQLPAKGLRFWIFALLAIVFSLALQKVLQSSYSGWRVRRLVEAGIFSILATGLFFALAYYLQGDSMPIPVTIPFVGLPLGLFVWLTLPLVAVLIAAKRDSF
jgi:hypothetical protein